MITKDKLIPTSSQTVGPYFRIAMQDMFDGEPASQPDGENIEIHGQVLDCDGTPVSDAVLEFWGITHAASDAILGAHGHECPPGFCRALTDPTGNFTAIVRRPVSVPTDDGSTQAPHFLVLVFMRGLLRNLITRVYFGNESSNASDPVLNDVPQERRSTLIAQPDGKLLIDGILFCRGQEKRSSLHGKEMPSQSSNDLNSFLFSTPEMSHVFSAESQLLAMMRFECALTYALEKCGIAEAGSGSVLESLQPDEFIDIHSLLHDARLNGNIAIPFVRQLTAAVNARNEPMARSIHLGATSQDVLDTAVVLQIRNAVGLLEQDIEILDSSLVHQIKTHAKTVLCGRTWLQVGPPTTLGLKLAGTLAAIRRNRNRLHGAAVRLLTLQFGGAVGTRSALGADGPRVAAELAKILDLQEPTIPWHTQRDNIVEIVQVLALLTGSLAKFAKDVSLLMQSEVAEVSEEGGADRGGSSTMPHKHNPVACAAVLAIHGTMPGMASTMLTAMTQEHERGLGSWQAEWETVPEAFRRTAAALAYSVEIAARLKVDEVRMRANLDASLGLPMSEAVSTFLSQKIGRSKAHDLLRSATGRAFREKKHLAEVLKSTPEIVALITPAEIDQLLNPDSYLGSAQEFIDRVLKDE